MINIYTVLTILFIHWILDFIFQTDYEAKNKSKSWLALLSHTIKYSVWWTIPITILVAVNFKDEIIVLQFVLITFICHTITDYFTSRLNSKLWEQATFWNNSYNKEKYGNYATSQAAKHTHMFFVSLGFNQFSHFIQLLLTYYYLMQ